MARDETLRQDDLVTDGSQARRRLGWIERRRLRYKRHDTVPLEDVRGELKTGDIILFHKTTRAGILDTLELDLLAPLFFPENEFRHSGIIVRRADDLSVVECTEEFHSGHAHAVYPTGGKGIREAPLVPLLDAYTRGVNAWLEQGGPSLEHRLLRLPAEPWQNEDTYAILLLEAKQLHNLGDERIRAAYGNNYNRLAEIKSKWDPENLFCMNKNIAPAA